MSQDRRVRAVSSALMTLIIFLAVPYLSSPYIPAALTRLLEQSGIELQELVIQLMSFGLISAAITLVKGFVRKSSVINLGISMVQQGVGLILAILLLGLGDVGSLGVTSFTVNVVNTVNLVTLNFRAFIYFTMLTVLLGVLEAYLEWKEARIEEKSPEMIPPEPHELLQTAHTVD